MAVLAIRPIVYSRNYSTQHATSGKEAPSSVFNDGNLLVGTATGYGPAAAGAGAAAGGLVLANAAGQNSATPLNDVPFVLLDGVSWIEITAFGVSTAALLQENVPGYGYAIDGTTGNGYLNLADTTNVVFKIIDSRPIRGVVGDTNVRVKAVVLPSKRVS